MPIICFEGASAAGKTTLSKYLCDKYNAYAVPEVNLLFGRTGNESQFWYFERQIERWKIAVKAARNYEIVILDGDAFQPLWYNWAYDFDFGEPPEEITNFYRKALAAGEIDFPDKYFIFSVESDELRKRKVSDASRTRKNFERHLGFIEPQRAFFDFVKSINKDLVEFVENRKVEETAGKIINSIGNAHSGRHNSLEIFDAAKSWLENNDAGKFTFAL
jgi:thymidylate kinase